MKQKHFSFALALMLIASILFQACKPKASMQTANAFYTKKEYFNALESYKAVYSNSKDRDEKKEAGFKAAECYRQINDSKNAETWYRKVIKIKYEDPVAIFRYAEALKNNGKYAEAITQYKKYQQKAPNDPDVAKAITGCELALKWKDEKTRFNVENYKRFNTKYSDHSPYIQKRNTIYFTSDREEGTSREMYGWTGNPHTDLYVSEYERRRKRHGKPTIVKGAVNTKYNDGVACFDKRGSTMYYTQCNGTDSKGKTCKIFTSSLRGREWTEPVALPFNSDSSYNCGHPSLSRDGKVLYFSSDMPGGYGGKDIYMVTYVKRGRTWSDPINLGPEVNTAGHDMYPYIHPTGTLYYATDGKVTLGGLDIHYTTGSGTEWTEPVNLKSPINSSGDDFAIIMNEEKNEGYFSSNRIGGRGNDDIYRFYMTPLIFTISGYTKHLKTKEIIPGSKVSMKYKDTVISAISDESGYYKFTLAENTDYNLIATKEDYIDSKDHDQTTKGLEYSTDLTQDFLLDEFDYSALIKLEGIYYDLDKAFLREKSKEILDSLVKVLNKYPRMRVELGSHTDCRADSLYNEGLSQRRADSAVTYIIKNGIDSDRIVAKGYGETSLVNGCACEGSYVSRPCNEAEHQQNRRTTVRFLDNKYIPKDKKEMEKVGEKIEEKPKQPQRRRRSPR